MSQAGQVLSEKGKARAKKKKSSLSFSEDLALGQTVIVTARWILVGSGLLLALWNPGPIGELRIQIMTILLLAMANFYLQAQLLMKRPAITEVIYAASAADLLVITVLIITGGGFESSMYIFYFPAILAFSVAFPTILTAIFVAAIMFVYAAICLFTPQLGADVEQIVVVRLVIIAAVAMCSNQYWRIERARRAAAVEARKALVSEIRHRRAEPA